MSNNIQHYVVTPELLVEIDESCDMSLVYMDSMPVWGDYYVAEVLDGEAVMVTVRDGNWYDYNDLVEEFGGGQPEDGQTIVIFEIGYSLDGELCELMGMSRDDLNGLLCRIWGLDTDDPDEMDALERYISGAYRMDYGRLQLHMVRGLCTEDGDWTPEHVRLFERTVGVYVDVE